MPLTPDEINALLFKKAPQGKPKKPASVRPTLGYPPPEQDGPLRWYEKPKSCASRGCGSSTYCRLKGIPYCTMHALKEMNEMLIRLGEPIVGHKNYQEGESHGLQDNHVALG